MLNEITVIHEVAHITSSRKKEAHHGSSFVIDYLFLVRKIFGKEKEQKLRGRFIKHNVIWNENEEKKDHEQKEEHYIRNRTRNVQQKKSKKGKCKKQ
jgi:hypothetical protein